MIDLTNDSSKNIRELFKSGDVETLFMQFISILEKKHAGIIARTVPLSGKYVMTIVCETKEHHLGEQGMYQTFFGNHDTETWILDK